jgi:hypothetical protein
MCTLANDNNTDDEMFYTPGKDHYVSAKRKVKEEIEKASSLLVAGLRHIGTDIKGVCDMVQSCNGSEMVDNEDKVNNDWVNNISKFMILGIIIPFKGTSAIDYSVPLKDTGSSLSEIDHTISTSRESSGACVLYFTVSIKSLRASASGVVVTLCLKGIRVGELDVDATLYIKGVGAGAINGDVTIPGRIKL